MVMTDPIADLLTRIRNALRINRRHTDVPASKMKRGILDVLVREGYIVSYDVLDTPPSPTIRIALKYGPDGEQLLSQIKRESRPGRRLYWSAKQVKPVLSGMGISILSTHAGILSDRECRKQKVGGEVLCTIW